jgi:hypothetical protein
MQYNTVFDDSILETLLKPTFQGDGTIDAALARKTLHDHGVDVIAVDWNWVRQYKQPGNYGYTDFVSEERFAALLAAGVLVRTFEEPGRSDKGLELYRVQPEISPR